MADALYVKQNGSLVQLDLGGGGSGAELVRTSVTLDGTLAAGAAVSVPSHKVGGNQLLLWINGVLVASGEQYTDLSETTVAFTADLPAGTEISCACHMDSTTEVTDATAMAQSIADLSAKDASLEAQIADLSAKLKELSGSSEILLAAHPVGSLYWSSEATDPSDLFGGTWERIKDRFILAAGDDYAVGATGGEVSHAITKAELPAVSPQIAVSTAGYLPKGAALGAINRIGASKTVGSGTFTDRVVGEAYSEGTPAYEDATTIAPLGDGEAMPIMPPYETYYCWKRTA